MYIKETQNDRNKNIINRIFFKLNNQPFPHITTKEYNMILNVFDVVSTIYEKYKPKGRKSFFKLPLRFETNIDSVRENRI